MDILFFMLRQDYMGGLEGADVASLLPDDAPLHVVGRQGDDTNRHVSGVAHGRGGFPWPQLFPAPARPAG